MQSAEGADGQMASVTATADKQRSRHTRPDVRYSQFMSVDYQRSSVAAAVAVAVLLAVGVFLILVSQMLSGEMLGTVLYAIGVGLLVIAAISLLALVLIRR
jgi:uncharacterized Tic20 family protein